MFKRFIKEFVSFEKNHSDVLKEEMGLSFSLFFIQAGFILNTWNETFFGRHCQCCCSYIDLILQINK